MAERRKEVVIATYGYEVNLCPNKSSKGQRASYPNHSTNMSSNNQRENNYTGGGTI
jgi:hypothetical protein